MRAIEIHQAGQAGGPAAVRTPAARTVHASGVNCPDELQRLSHYPVPLGAPDLAGLEVSDEIVVGDLGGSSFEKGDTVRVLIQGGAYAEF